MRQGLALEIYCNIKEDARKRKENNVFRDDYKVNALKSMKENENKDFSAKKFVDNLLAKGASKICDETSDSFHNNDLPSFYNEQMFKRGQAVFYYNCFGMFLGNLLGLLCGLAMDSSLAILTLTKMSSTHYTAYKRYIATILHMIIWYDSDFKPGSKLWQSIKDVKFKHNSASKKSKCILNIGINQKDMALTQFGFMGFSLIRRSFLGIYNMNEYDARCFVHIWRVLGYTLGVDEEFNICRESVNETKAICDELLSRVIKPQIENNVKKEYNEMVSYLIDGLWSLNPFLDTETFQFYLKMVLNNHPLSCIPETDQYKNLSRRSQIKIKVIILTIELMRFSLVRIVLNYLQRIALWIIQTYPFLAFYRYGKANSYVNVMGPN